MVAPGETLEGSIPVPSTYPNPLANNVNMQPMGWSRGEGAVSAQNAPVNLGLGGGGGGGGGGSVGIGLPTGLTFAFFGGVPYEGSGPHNQVAYLVGADFDLGQFPENVAVAQENDLTLADGFDYSQTPGDGVQVAMSAAEVALDPPVEGTYLIYLDLNGSNGPEGNVTNWGWDPFDPAYTGE